MVREHGKNKELEIQADGRVTLPVCRACKSRNMELVIALGLHPPANAFLQPQQLHEPESFFPLDMHVCLDCALIQVPNYIPEGFFKNYVYVPSASATMQQHFQQLAAVLAGQLAVPDGLVVDIGSNDGVLLAALKDRGVRNLGVDPASNLAAIARQKGVAVVEEYFNPTTARQIRGRVGPAAVIVTTNTFNHIDDLHGFMQGVGALLHDRGVFVVEVPQALDLITHNEFDTVYHEHLSEFSVKSLVDLFRFFEMEIVNLERLEIHGGSMRVAAKRNNGHGRAFPLVAEWVAREHAAGLFSRSPYTNFAQRILKLKEQLLQTLRQLKITGQRIVGYGAPAKGNTILNYCGIGPELLDYLVDRNPLKHGLYSPGRHLPVFPVEKILQDQPDYLLVLAWNFLDEVLAEQAEYRSRGGKFVVPVPDVRVI